MGDPLNGVIFGTILVIVGLSTYVTGDERDDPAGTITITFFVPAVNDGSTVLICDWDVNTVCVVKTPSHVICDTLTKLDPVIVIVDPANFTIFGLIFVMVGGLIYSIDDIVVPPTEFTCNGYVPIVDAGKRVIILVWENDDIASGDDPIVKDKGVCDVL